MKSILLESEIEKYYLSFVRAHHGVALKLKSRNWPDRVVIWPEGKTCFVELKRPGGKVRAGQKAIHEQMRQLGHRVFVIDRRDQFETTLA